MKNLKVAIVHDFLNSWGGAERVVSAFHEIWPQAPIFTSLYDKKLKEKVPEMEEWDIRFPRRLQGRILGKFPKYITFVLPYVFESFDLSGYDLVISSSAAFAKGVMTRPGTLHINYCHTPPRFLYGYRGETRKRDKWYWQPILKPLDSYLRLWDFLAAQRPDFIVGNSETVRRRIKKFYRREAKVIYPPVSAVGLKAESRLDDQGSKLGGGYFLVVSRLSAYKNVDLVIEVCNRLGLSLKVAGTGKEERRLRQLAGGTVEVLGFVSEEQLAHLYEHCQAVICPTGDEDFGIVPVEANAFGKPVIALKSGGLLESIVEGKTGEFFKEAVPVSLGETLQQFNSLNYESEVCKKNAERFGRERFKNEFYEFVEACWVKFSSYVAANQISSQVFSNS